MAKYDAMGRFLEDVPAHESEVELTFGFIDTLVGSLPPSARTTRTWWGNSSHVQSLAWRRSGWHVRAVDMAGRTVVFARGRVGGTYADRSRIPADPTHSSAPRRGEATCPSPPLAPVGAPVDVRVTFRWSRLGAVTLDPSDKLLFPRPVPAMPGIYSLTLTGIRERPQVYIGESDNLRRRLTSNYRNPGPRQRTSLRINALVRAHLAAGGQVEVAISTAAEVSTPTPPAPLDLSRKAGRLLVESAAVVLAQIDGTADLENLG
ncbi:DUF7662 domain-containing protein [Nocardioides daphniae]|uniref:DUF7662 domain-containing protein n=1 Tax=Nocardioides daphniae TaxID=402297 RepID=A0A4P7UAA8_9ACTN|nr:hypothetical protein [Nocardioides daphniae]QCC76245.1 hypothetical protein E2C04_01735 [Nocardioides daphniae]GGD08676.1 hypothetical protein GCM10007231_04390 [Nocardioides daphniae]